MNSKVNLFVVGYPKSATTSLFQYLTQHPQVFKPAIKEPHFFSKDFIEEARILKPKGKIFAIDQTIDYESNYAGLKDEKIVPDFSTSYIYSQVAFANMAQYNPKAKIILVYRHPLQIMHSWFKHMQYLGLEPELDFKNALDLEDSRLTAIDLPGNAIYPSSYGYRQIVNFEDHAHRMLQSFSKEQFLVLDFIDIVNDPRKVVQRIFEFLELSDESENINYSKANESKSVRFASGKKIISKLILDNQLLLKLRLKWPRSYEWLQQKYHAFFSQKMKRSLDTSSDDIDAHYIKRQVDFVDSTWNIQLQLNAQA